MFQALEEHGAGVAKILSNSYAVTARQHFNNPCVSTRASIVDTGLRLGKKGEDAQPWYVVPLGEISDKKFLIFHLFKRPHGILN